MLVRRRLKRRGMLRVEVDDVQGFDGEVGHELLVR